MEDVEHLELNDVDRQDRNDVDYQELNDVDHLLKSLLADVQDLFSVTVGCDSPGSHVSCESNLLGTVIVFKVHWTGEKADFIDTLREVLSLSSSIETILSGWIQDHRACLSLIMGSNVWQSTRRDRLLASRVWSAGNDVALASVQRTQLVHVTYVQSHIEELALKVDQPASVRDTYQRIVCFLVATLRLNAIDVTTVIQYLLSIGWHKYENLVLQAQSPMIRYALEALAHAKSHDYLDRFLESADNQDKLAALSARYDLSAANRKMLGTWPVLIQCSNRALLEQARSIQPSFFINKRGDWLPQIHVLEQSVANHRYTLLACFRLSPCETAIQSMIDAVFEQLKVKKSAKVITTRPTFNVTEDSRLFREDGVLRMTVIDRILSPALREALSTRGSGEGTVLGFELIKIPKRLPVVFVIWVRRSRDENVQSFTIARQAWSILANPPDCLRYATNLDKVIIAIENCSSSQHPLKDRRLMRSIPKNQPIFLLTTNPDRMTRRQEEVSEIVSIVERSGGAWYTKGMASEHNQAIEWSTIGDEASQDRLRDRLRIGTPASIMRCIRPDISRAPTCSTNGVLLALCH